MLLQRHNKAAVTVCGETVPFTILYMFMISHGHCVVVLMNEISALRTDGDATMTFRKRCGSRPVASHLHACVAAQQPH
jgi:hypothetical protein